MLDMKHMALLSVKQIQGFEKKIRNAGNALCKFALKAFCDDRDEPDHLISPPTCPIVGNRSLLAGYWKSMTGKPIDQSISIDKIS